MGRLVEMLWDCPYCDRKAIPGKHRECPGCGMPRGDDVKFYMPDKIEYVSESEAEKINKNPDWYCPYCETLNSDNDAVCKSCSHPREKNDIDYFELLKKNKESKESTSSYESESDYEYNSYSNSNNEEVEKEDSEVTENKASFFGKIGNVFKNINPKVIICIVSIIAVIAGILALAIPRTVNMKVDQIKWQYSMDIEKYQTVHENSWSYPPIGARNIREKVEFYEYEKVFDHYERRTKTVSKDVIVGQEAVIVGYKDLGNGYAEEQTEMRDIHSQEYEEVEYTEAIYRDEAVYKTKYYYDIDKWLFDRTVHSSGYDRNPYWPEVELSDIERISGRDAKFFVIAIDEKGKSDTIKVSYEEWQKIEIGMNVVVKKWIFTSKIVFEN